MLNSQRERDLSVLRDGSPNFPHNFGALLATENEYVEMASIFPASRKYAPLKTLVLTNDSGERLSLEINGIFYAMVPAGTVANITDKAIWSFRITNISATATAAGEVRANVSTPPMGADELARIQHLGIARF